MNIKEEVSGNKMVTFVHYRDGELWYQTESGFKFPVPISDIGNATFLAKDRAMLFMRYMRKFNEQVETAKEVVAEVVAEENRGHWNPRFAGSKCPCSNGCKSPACDKI